MSNRKKIIWKKRTAPYFLLLPMVALITIFMLYPIYNTFWLSLRNHVLTNMNGMGFNGVGNFIQLMNDEIFKKASINSIFWTLLNVILQLVFGMIVALLLNKSFCGRTFFRALLFTPWAVGGMLVALIWSFMFNESVGIINDLLLKAGFISQKISWFSNGVMSMWAAIIANTWRGIPFFAISILSALQTIPHEIYESADIDGVSVFTKFYRVTLPMIKDTVLLTTLLRTIWTLNIVDILYGMTMGGPNFSTMTIPLYIMTTFNNSLNAGYSSAMAVVIILIMIIFSVLYLKIGKYGKEELY